MAVCDLRLSQDNVLQKMTSATVILPEGKARGPFPVFYLLHGLSDDHTAWLRRSNVERYVERWPMIVVMPNGERSFYTDAITNPRAAFETFITRDLVGTIDRLFQTIPTRAGRVIGGLSMGGYGALKLALKHPDLFRSAVSHSGAVGFATNAFGRARDEAWKAEWTAVFGEHPRGGSEDLYAIVERADRATLPALRIDCGVDDFLIEDNRAFHAHLTQLGIAHEYAEYPGAHDWDYWDEHIQESIAFFGRELGIEPYQDEQ
jgi:putative tributyrin esterase